MRKRCNDWYLAYEFQFILRTPNKYFSLDFISGVLSLVFACSNRLKHDVIMWEVSNFWMKAYVFSTRLRRQTFFKKYMKRSVSKSDITFSISEAAQPLFPSGSAGSFDFETNSERLCFRCECLNNLCDDPIAYNLISYYTHNLNDFFCLKLYKFGI